MLNDNNFCYNILKNLPIPVIVIDKNCRIMGINSNAERLLNKASQCFFKEQDSEDKYLSACLRLEITDFIESDLEEFTFEKMFIVDYDEFYFHIKINKIINELDNTEAILISLYNITEQKKTELSLKSSERKLDSIFKALPDIYFIIDSEGRFLDCKARDMDDLISHPENFIGKNIEDFLPYPLSYEMKSAILRAIKTKSLVVFEYDLTLPKGLQHFEARMIPFSNTEAIVILRNITKRKQSDEEILKIEKLNSIGTLAGGVAHDFNNILTIILGNISMLRTYKDHEDKIKCRLLNIEKTVLQAKDLTNQLLTFSKGSNLIKKVTYISNLLRDTTILALSGSNVVSNINLPFDLWPVEIDTGQISQVISNLVINACQAMPNGGTIAIKARNTKLLENEIVGLSPGKYVNISFKDQGIGIDESNLIKIFDPYFTTKKTGSGLGLTSCYSIIKKHNGHISVRSKVGKGTVFQIYLPACEGVPVEMAEVKESIFHGENKILVMDDEPEIRKIIHSMLRHLGYDVRLSKDGLEAIQLYKEALNSDKPFDAVIMDLTIPGGMGGEEAIRNLLKIHPNIKAIVSSGYSDSSIIADYTNYGFKGVINKPYTIEELSKELNKVLSS